MPVEIKIAAVGDILFSSSLIISSMAQSKVKQKYDFTPIFRHVTPILQAADLTIGNLEIPLAGRERRYTKIHPRTGFFTFNCPDELAQSLKVAGFDLLTTANNHCLDRGFEGLCRTLNVLDQYGLSYTGTYRTKEEASHYFIREVKGIKVGILAYSKSTNKIPVPSDKAWCVNLIDERRMIHDLQALKKDVDLVIVCVHFGREYQHKPTLKQKGIVQMLLNHGADIVLGSHPHVIQPSVFISKKKFAVYSLGNFISTTLNNNHYTRNGVIVQLIVTKDDTGNVAVSCAHFIPTWVKIVSIQGKRRYRILPVPESSVQTIDPNLSPKDWSAMKSAAMHTLNILHASNK